ncbi:beta-ketoacyl synthase N-terminal-like domain-containing protein [Salinarimonas sp.]|uniref:beta-ketoacyl synthase N-terminal-like domain-containing protein n=1 Tax=Salinarimonas sp. TaxID=2766526 RepID=UPI0032D9950B
MIAITGMGCVTGFGTGVPALEAGLRRGASALRAWYRDAFAYARVPGIDDDRTDRCAMLLELAINEALNGAGLHEVAAPLPLLVGSTHGELGDWEARFDPESTACWAAPAMPVVRSAALQGRARQMPFSVTTACTASAHALAYAGAQIRAGLVDRVVVAGGDVVSDFLMQGFVALRAMSRAGCTPFAAGREGISLGEGAAALVVERADAAQARGAEPLAYVTGVGCATDAFRLTAPEPSGQAMSRAILMSMGERRDAPDFINVHGTGSELNDSMEYHALARVFGERLRDVRVSATKNATGHTCGAAAALELIICILALQGAVTPGILGTAAVDEQFEHLAQGASASSTRKQPATAVTMNCAFGGSNTAVFVERAV